MTVLEYLAVIILFHRTISCTFVREKHARKIFRTFHNLFMSFRFIPRKREVHAVCFILSLESVVCATFSYLFFQEYICSIINVIARYNYSSWPRNHNLDNCGDLFSRTYITLLVSPVFYVFYFKIVLLSFRSSSCKKHTMKNNLIVCLLVLEGMRFLARSQGVGLGSE